MTIIITNDWLIVRNLRRYMFLFDCLIFLLKFFQHWFILPNRIIFECDCIIKLLYLDFQFFIIFLDFISLLLLCYRSFPEWTQYQLLNSFDDRYENSKYGNCVNCKEKILLHDNNLFIITKKYSNHIFIINY